MDDKQRLQLHSMIKANNTEDQTDFIRNLKHSQIIRNDVNNLISVRVVVFVCLDFLSINDLNVIIE